jgi:hypothetical protein
MNFVRAAAWVLCFATTAVAQSANASYFGKWHFNPDKSDFGSVELTWKKLPDGRWQQIDERGRSYTFAMDGKEYRDQVGDMVAMRQLNATTWEATTHRGGNVVSTETATLSSDGRTLSVSATLGTAGTESVELHRTSGTTGLEGTWKTGKTNMAPFDLFIEHSGPDGVIFRVPNALECKAAFDGEPYPLTGPQALPNMTCTLKRTGQGFSMVQTSESGTMNAEFSVSADGSTLTEHGKNGTTVRRWVFDRVK